MNGTASKIPPKPDLTLQSADKDKKEDKKKIPVEKVSIQFLDDGSYVRVAFPPTKLRYSQISMLSISTIS